MCTVLCRQPSSPSRRLVPVRFWTHDGHSDHRLQHTAPSTVTVSPCTLLDARRASRLERTHMHTHMETFLRDSGAVSGCCAARQSVAHAAGTLRGDGVHVNSSLRPRSPSDDSSRYLLLAPVRVSGLQGAWIPDRNCVPALVRTTRFSLRPQWHMNQYSSARHFVSQVFGTDALYMVAIVLPI